MKADIVIIGAGASGLFCASLLAKKGINVIVVDKGKRAGRKILISGGGRCNFTNLDVSAQHYISTNPHFCKSALSRFTCWDFIQLMQQNNISYHERQHGQLFCDDSAQDILQLLLAECRKNGVQFYMQHELITIHKNEHGFELNFEQGSLQADKVIVATGGLSLPKLGTSPIGYKIAEQFGIPVVPVHAGLVPFTLDKKLLDELSPLAGIAVPVSVTTDASITFTENMLFTHRGLSGPAILQISNYWKPGQPLSINLVPDTDLMAFLNDECQHFPHQMLKTSLNKKLPKRLVDYFYRSGQLDKHNIQPELLLKQSSQSQLTIISDIFHHWIIYPNATEGYRTAEVTLGGVDTHYLSSKTMEASNTPGLYFIGEVVDVTGWLGGYNFQWAWSSAWVCAKEINPDH